MERIRRITFPEWAPRELVDLFESQGRSVVDHDSLLHRLLTYEGMERVWRLVQEHNPGEPGFTHGPVYFADVVKATAYLSGLSYLSKGEAVDRTKEILELTIKLSRKIRNDIEINSIPVYMDCLPSRLQLDFLTSPYLDGLDGAITVATLLDKLTENLKVKLAEQHSVKPILPYPKTERAREIFFIRRMGEFFKTYFGKYYYERLAILTRAALDLEEGLMHGDFVRQTLR